MKRGEVWEVNLDPTIGAEIKKTRPCVLVGRDALARLPLKIIVPITGWNDSFAGAPWHVRLEPSSKNGLSKTCSADTYQVRCISEGRLIRMIGKLDDSQMGKINAGLMLCMSLD